MSKNDVPCVDIVNICSFSTYFPTNLCTVGFSKVIWLGDLNYRIALSYADTKKLLMENDWDALFEKDQVTFLSHQERACA
jgi:hypothetical protein